MASARLSTVVLDAPDAHALAGFYLRLLGYVVRAEEPDWVLIGPPGGGTALSFRRNPHTSRRSGRPLRRASGG